MQASYGGPEGLKKLVDACHARGIAVFLDVVYNHLGPEGNYLGKYGPYFTDRYCTPWGYALNFDGAWSDGVREYFSNNPLHWFEHYHLDRLRLDAIHTVYDTGAVSFWELAHGKKRGTGAKAWPSAVLDSGERLEQPQSREDTGGRRLRLYGPVAGRLSSLPVCAALSGGSKILRGLRADGAAGKSLHRWLCAQRRVCRVPQKETRRHLGGCAGRQVCGLHPKPRPGGQPCREPEAVLPGGFRAA
ncbi:alpha-amylase family glycosyl hydrolase [Pontibacter korlensis]|uniref:alpha-amylase family glycosyl hydrolase n=1 Tax=Pontibacter korlensis TaxID=400092 RepID=UPI001F1B0780|nr:alpha-amylase family glycosyl hydrolase [Pontibacter korlensis]